MRIWAPAGRGRRQGVNGLDQIPLRSRRGRCPEIWRMALKRDGEQNNVHDEVRRALRQRYPLAARREAQGTQRLRRADEPARMSLGDERGGDTLPLVMAGTACLTPVA